jgi:hypothetical protein
MKTATAVPLLALALGVALSFASGGERAAFTPPVAEGIGVAWDHPRLLLFLREVDEYQGHARYTFFLEVRPGEPDAVATVGHPSYRTHAGDWRPAVIQGVVGRHRELVVRSELTGTAFFAVVVPHEAAELSIPVAGEVVRIQALPPSSLTEPRTDVEDPWTFPEPVAETAEAPGLPVRLSAGVRWSGERPFGDGALDGGESDELLVDVYNAGERVASGAELRATISGGDRIAIPAAIAVPDIDPGTSVTVRVPLQALADLEDGTVRLVLVVVEPFGHDAAPVEVEIVTRAAALPRLVLIEDFAVEGADLPVPRDRVVTLRLRVRNVGQGVAEAAEARVSPDDGVFTAHDSPERFELGTLAPGAVQEIEYRCYANQRAARLGLTVELSHARSGDEPSTSILGLPLEGAYGEVPRIVRLEAQPRAETPLEPAPPPLTADVDRHVPLTPVPRSKALAVVIGVERYAAVPPASFAAADARTAARYLRHAVGIPAERVELLIDDDVTLGRLQRTFDRDGWLARRVEEDSDVFVYFAGHGVAEAKAFEPYLLPHDGDMSYVRQTGLSLDTLVERLAALDAASVTLFLDACFSGLTREGGALVGDTRRLVVVPVQRVLAGVSVFSAARGSQTAHALDEQGHGLFSYFLFRGLGGAADLDGDRTIRAGELKLYLDDEVPRAALLADVEQTPAIFPDDPSQVLVRLP